MEGLTLHSIGVVLSEVGSRVWSTMQTLAFWQNLGAFLLVMFVMFAVVFVIFYLSFKFGFIKPDEKPAIVDRLRHLDDIASNLRNQGMEDAAKVVEAMK